MVGGRFRHLSAPGRGVDHAMTTLLRLLAIGLLAALLALPGRGHDGGENGSGTGVWVLPRATHLGPTTGCAPRATFSVNPNQACVLRASDDLGVAVGTIVEEGTGVVASVAVIGSDVCLPAAMLQALFQAGAKATIVVVDSSQLGYVIEVSVVAGKLNLRVF